MPNTNISFIETTGFSMWPFLRTKDKLIVKRVSLESLKIGDIILYVKDSQSVCHRLIKKFNRGGQYLLYARGDNSKSIEFVHKDMFKGKVIGVLRRGRIRNLTKRYQQFINRIVILSNPFIRGSLKIAKFLVKGG